MKNNVFLLHVSANDMKASSISQAGVEHIGLGCLSSYLREKKWGVYIYNMDVFVLVNRYNNQNAPYTLNDFSSDIIDKIQIYSPLLVGLSVSMMNIKDSIELAKIIKKRFPQIKICLGGNQASICCVDILKNEKHIDYIIVGDGEIALEKLLSHILSNAYKISEIDNVAYRLNQKVKCNTYKYTTKEELDNFPMPSRDDLIYLSKNIPINQARIITSRGCNARCTFCCDVVINKERRWIPRDPIMIVDEIEILHNKLGVNFFWINDDNFITPSVIGRHRAELIANEIINRKLHVKYRALFRPDVFIKNDPLLKLLKDSGLSIAYIGFESGSQRKLKRYAKNVSVDSYYNLVSILNQNEIGIQIGFIMFDAYTTYDDLELDATFLYDIEEMCLFTNFTQKLDVFPYTPISSMMINDKLICEILPYNSPVEDYLFKDKAIKNLYECLNQIYTSNVIDLDGRIQRIKLHHCHYYTNKSLKEEIESAIKKINKNNYLFFKELLYICKYKGVTLLQTKELSDIYIKSNQTIVNYIEKRLKII